MKLEPSRGPVDVLFIDNVAPPSENDPKESGQTTQRARQCTVRFERAGEVDTDCDVLVGNSSWAPVTMAL